MFGSSPGTRSACRGVGGIGFGRFLLVARGVVEIAQRGDFAVADLHGAGDDRGHQVATLGIPVVINALGVDDVVETGELDYVGAE